MKLESDAWHRVNRVRSQYYIYNVNFDAAVDVVDKAYRDGFAASIALLKEPSDKLVSDILEKRKHDGIIYLRDLLRAAADAIDSGEGA